MNEWYKKEKQKLIIGITGSTLVGGLGTAMAIGNRKSKKLNEDINIYIENYLEDYSDYLLNEDINIYIENYLEDYSDYLLNEDIL